MNFDAIGNFFGGLFGRKKKEDEQKPQVTVKRPSSSTLVVRDSPTSSTRVQDSLIPVKDNTSEEQQLATLKLGGVKEKVEAKPKQEQKAPSIDFNRGLASLVKAPGEFAKGILDTTVDVARAVPRAIKSGGLQLSGGTEYIPKTNAEKALYGDAPVKNLEGYGRESANQLDTLGKTKIDVGNNKVYTEQGDLGNKLPASVALPLGLILAVTDATPLGGARKKAVKAVTEGVADEALAKATKEVIDTVPAELPPVRTTKEVTVDAPSVDAPREVSSPITSTSTASRAPAITSPNRPAATVKAPEPVFTNPATTANQAPVVKPIEVPQPVQPKVATKIQTPDEAVMAAQKSIDEAAMKAPEQPVAAQAVNVEAPIAAEARQLAETQPPVAPVNEAQLAQEAINKAPTDAIANELGTISRRAAAEGRLASDADAQVLADQVGSAIDAESARLGTTWPEINKKVQQAWSNGAKDYREAGLTKEEFDVVRRAADELSLLRSRVDPSLLKDGQVGQFYSPRQARDTEFTQELVNELARGKNGAGLRTNELDLTTTPYKQAIRRYSNAPEALGDTLIDSLESKVVKDALGNERVVETGLKVSDEVKTAFKEDLKPYIEAQDDAIRAADSGNIKGIDQAVARGDKVIDDALNKMAAKLPKDSIEARNAIGAMIAERRAYMQSTVRTNMFTNVVNRIFDQTQKAIVNFGDQALPLVNKVTNLMTGTSQPGIATDRISTALAKKYSKGALVNQQNRNFMTNVRLAGATARNPLTKGLAKVDAAYRAAGTYLTSLGDMSTNAVKATNLTILGRGRAEGLKTADELEAYLAKNLNSPEYMDIYRNMTNLYSGYIGMPQTLTSTGVNGSKASEFFSKIDNFAKNALDKAPIPNRVKQEINDLIMPAITGFAGATSRVAAKQLNALALGLPNMGRGLKLAASDSPNAKAIGQMMISRSIIDGIAAAGIGVGGLMLGSSGQWTGQYPEDANERARWEAEGIQPDAFSFNVDGKTVYIQPGRMLGVLALPAVLPAVIGEAQRNGTDVRSAVESVISGTIGQFNQNLGADAIVSHMGDIDSIVNNKSDKDQAMKSLISMLGYSISNVNPAAGLQNNIAAANDPYKRDTGSNLIDVIKNRNPVTRPTLDVKKDNLGNPIENSSQLSLGSSAVTIGDGQGSSTPSQGQDTSVDLTSEINRLAQAKFEVMPARDVKNSNSQEDAKMLMGSSLYANADDETKAEYLKDTLLGTKTKDINKELDPTERSALIEYKLQSEDQRKVWLENNDNAANYYTGNYNNAVANGTLSSDDDNLENKKGAKYQMLRAQVDKELGADSSLKMLYDDTSVEEFRAMVDPGSEDYDLALAERLANYDAARTEAGVSGKSGSSSKPKYSLKKGSGFGSGSGSSGGSDKFVFASLPSSLVGSATSGGKNYGDEAPTFKPIADLKTSSAAQIPKGRTISVKKGIQI